MKRLSGRCRLCFASPDTYINEASRLVSGAFCERCADVLSASLSCPTEGFHTRFIAQLMSFHHPEDLMGFIEAFHATVFPEKS